MHKKGLHPAIISAILFGLSPVACKAIVGDMPALLLAGLLYLGSGVGLTGIVLGQKPDIWGILRALSRRQSINLAGAILAGGVVAPLFLAYGIRYGTATEVSLLLYFETVATTMLAYLLFHEHIGLRTWLGKVFIIVASILVIVSGSNDLQISVPGLSVLAACLLWGLDNNLTRELESIPASLLACMKGWIAGIFNVTIALLLFESSVTTLQVSGVLFIGALSYGASLLFFIKALREIGAARTSTWFASGPLIGSLLSVIVLGERPPGEYWLAALIMLSGMFFLYGEKHRHLHQHEAINHAHTHTHDEHHHHEHDDGELEENHNHIHVHESITHAHIHWPDIHHRHLH
jgi:drug/metabolite transporter (DMT)-like permease